MIDKQQGWDDALNIVIERFNDFAWKKDLAQERKLAAADMEQRVERECLGQSQEYQQTMFGVMMPFCKTLTGDTLPIPPFNVALPEAEGQGRNDALEIVLDTFSGFARRKDLQMELTCSEIAEEMEKLVEHEGREKSKDCRLAMADVVSPFYTMLKDEPL